MKDMEARALSQLTPFRRAKESQEQRLIARAREGPDEAAEALIRRYWNSAQRTAYLTTMDLSASEDGPLLVRRRLHRWLATWHEPQQRRPPN